MNVTVLGATGRNRYPPHRGTAAPRSHRHRPGPRPRRARSGGRPGHCRGRGQHRRRRPGPGPGRRRCGRVGPRAQKLGGAVAADKAREYAAFAASDLDWTLVRPPRLVDGPATGRITHDAHTPGRSSSIRRTDLAIFLADVLDQHLYPRQAPFASSAK